MADKLPPEKIDNQSQDSTDRLSLLKSRLSIAKTFCKKPHEAMKKWISEYEIEDFNDTDEVRDKVRIGYVFRKIESDQPAMFDDQPDIFIKTRKTAIKDLEPLFEAGYDYLWDVQRLDEKIEDVGLYFSLLGMGFLSSPYVTTTKKVPQPELDINGQPILDPKTGEPVIKMYDVPVIDNPMAEAEDPFKIYFSPETKFFPVMDYEHCPYFFKEKTMECVAIKAKYGKEVDTEETLSTDIVELDREIEEAKDVIKSDLKRAKVYEYYGTLPEENAKGIKGTWSYDKDYHILFTKGEELLVEECPYEHKPLFVIGNYGLANKFWKFGDAKHLMPLIQELQMYRSQILQHTRKMANPKPMIPDLANIDEAAFTDPRVGKPVKFSGQVPPTYLNPPALGQEVGVGVEQARLDLEKTSASFDLGGGSGQSSVKTPRGIQVYAEAADKQIARKKKKIARLIRELMIFQFKQIAQNWKPEDNKTLDVLSDQVSVDEKVLSIFGMPNVLQKLDIEVESLSVNKVQMKQDALNLWDQVKEHPEIFNLIECAKDLLQNGYGKKDADRYLLTEEQRKALAKPAEEKPKVNVSIKADAATPPGAALLENEGLLQSGQGEITVNANQQLDQANTAHQAGIDMAANQANQPMTQALPVNLQGGA